MDSCFQCQQPNAKQLCDFCPKYYHRKCFRQSFKHLPQNIHTFQQDSMCYYCTMIHEQRCGGCNSKIRKEIMCSFATQKQGQEQFSGENEIPGNDNQNSLYDIKSKQNSSIWCNTTKKDKQILRKLKCTICLYFFHYECTYFCQDEMKNKKKHAKINTFICQVCIQKFSTCHSEISRNKQIGQKQNEQIYIRVKSVSPLSWTQVPSNLLSKIIMRKQKQPKQHYSYNLIPNLSCLPLKKSYQKITRIQKIFAMRWTKQAQQYQQIYPEQAFSHFLNKALLIHQQQIINSNTNKYKDQQITFENNYGMPGNKYFLVKWEKYPWDMLCWEDETIVMQFCQKLFEFLIMEHRLKNWRDIITQKIINKVTKNFYINIGFRNYSKDSNEAIACKLVKQQIQQAFSDSFNTVDAININYAAILPKKINYGAIKQKISKIRQIICQTILRAYCSNSKSINYQKIVIIVTPLIDLWRKAIKNLGIETNTLIIQQLQNKTELEIIDNYFFKTQSMSPVFSLLILTYESYSELISEKMFRRFWSNCQYKTDKKQQKPSISCIYFDEFSEKRTPILPRHFQMTKFIINLNTAQIYLNLHQNQQLNQITRQTQKAKNLLTKFVSHQLSKICQIVFHENEDLDILTNIGKKMDNLIQISEQNHKQGKKMSEIVRMIFHQYAIAFGLNNFQKGIKYALIKFEPKYYEDISEYSESQYQQYLKDYAKILRNYMIDDDISEKTCKKRYFCSLENLSALFKHYCNLKRLQDFYINYCKKNMKGTPKYMPNLFLPQIANKFSVKPFVLYLIIDLTIRYGYSWRSFKKIYRLKNWDKNLKDSKQQLITNKQSCMNFGEFIQKQIDIRQKNSIIRHKEQQFIKRYLNTCIIETMKYLQKRNKNKASQN